MLQVNLWHLIVVGPLLFYIGNKKKEANMYAYIALTILALSIIFAVRFPKRLNYRGVINSAHYFIYIPMLLYIVYKNKNLPDWAFELIKYLALSVLAIHFYLLLKKIKIS